MTFEKFGVGFGGMELFIDSLEVVNFKSFDDQKISLRGLNILIGPNASGKTNFIESLRFIRDIAKHGLRNAVSMQGGVKYLLNINSSRGSVIRFKIVYKSEYPLPLLLESSLSTTTIGGVYEFSFKSLLSGDDFQVVKDRHRIDFKVSKKGKIGSGSLILNNRKGKISCKINTPKFVSKANIVKFKSIIGDLKLGQKMLLIESPFFTGFPFFFQKNSFEDISIYDFDPRISKRAAFVTGRIELEENGGNIAVVLKRLLENKEKWRDFLKILKNLLPFVVLPGVEPVADKSVIFTLKETYSDFSFPSFLISDGTINIIALIVALYFEHKPIVVIEEPERNIHPYLIAKVVRALKDASKNKQIFVTTHNPELLKYSDKKDVLLVSKNNEGHSTVSRLSKNGNAAFFMRSKLGIDDLFIKNLLEN